MALFPQGLRIKCSVIIDNFDLSTIGDVLMADKDSEVQSHLEALAPEAHAAWANLVAWAAAKQDQTRNRIFEEGGSCAAPVLCMPEPASRSAPPLQPELPLVRPLPASKRRKGVDIDAKDQAKRVRAAAAVLGIIRAAGPLSGLASEFSEHTAAAWEQSYLEKLTGGATQAGFEHNTLQRAVSAWGRWRKWLTTHKPAGNPFAPEPVDLAAFLKSVTCRGPTAAAGVFTSLEWVRLHARLASFPLDASIVEPFRQPQVRHLPAQQKPLDFAAFDKLVGILKEEAAVWRKCAVALVLRVLLSCLRFAHVQRASSVPAECTSRCVVWQIARGKAQGRGGFKTASPTFVADHLQLDSFTDPLFTSEHGQVKEWLLPDIIVGSEGLEGQCAFGDARMSRWKFFEIATHLLGSSSSDKVTGYTLRRWLPSVAHGLQLPLERRRDLGNWCDVVTGDTSQRVSEPMSVRYSEARLEATAQVKRLCLAAVLHLCRWASREEKVITWEHLAGCIKSIPRFEAKVRQAAWGHDPGPAPPPADVPSASGTSEAESLESSGQSSTASSDSRTTAPESDEGEVGQLDTFPPHMLEAIDWVAPLRSRQVHVRREVDLSTPDCPVQPLCHTRVYTIGFITGTGVEAAAPLGRQWCAGCLQKLRVLHPDCAVPPPPAVCPG